MGTREHSEPIAWILFLTLKSNYESSKLKMENKKRGLNGHVPEALFGYSMAITVWESFLHECFYDMFAEARFRKENEVFFEFKENIEKWDLETKTLAFPKWIIGKSFDKSQQPFQDFKKLIQIRNAISHFKMDRPPLSAIKELDQRKFTIRKKANEHYAWTVELSTIDCYKWAINTIVDMIHCLADFFPNEIRPFWADTFKKVD
jgi:hypothetical protein